LEKALHNSLRLIDAAVPDRATAGLATIGSAALKQITTD
jgi:hypothetical protein